MKRKVIIIAMAILLATSLIGCDIIEKPKDVNAPITEADATTNQIYIRSSDGELYKANHNGENFDSTSNESNSGRRIYTYNDSKYIPTLYADDLLILYTRDTLPNYFLYEVFKDVGYTVGVKLSKGTNGTYTFSASAGFGGSFASAVSEVLNNDQRATLLTVDGEAPKDDLINEYGLIGGMNNGDSKKIEFMVGSYYYSGNMFADMHTYISQETGTITSYMTTTNGYIIINIPEKLRGRFVSISGSGMMYISPKTRAEASPEELKGNPDTSQMVQEEEIAADTEETQTEEELAE